MPTAGQHLEVVDQRCVCRREAEQPDVEARSVTFDERDRLPDVVRVREVDRAESAGGTRERRLEEVEALAERRRC